MKKIFYPFLIALFLIFYVSAYSQTGWFQQTSGTSNYLYEICPLSDNTIWAVGRFGTIAHTENGGTNWTIQTILPNYDFASVYFINNYTGWVVGGPSNSYTASIILKTTDAGSTWFLQSPPVNTTSWNVRFLNSETGYICGHDGTIFKTINGGINWVSQYSGTMEELYKIQFTDASNGWIAGSWGAFLKTTNGGLNWNSVNLGTTNYLRGMYFTSALTGWVVGDGGLIYKTANGGNSFSLQSSGVSNYLWSAYFVNNQTGWATGYSGAILRTNNGGTNWFTQQSGVSNNLSSISFFNESTGWVVGNNGTVLKTTNGGYVTPLAPTLVSPITNSLIGTLTPTMTWNPSTGATAYCIQISYLPNFSVITDSVTVSNTNHIIPVGKLQNSTTYFWRVNASNNIGQSTWSSIWNFTILITGVNLIGSEVPAEFKLYQNYPNPFNPSTKIRFDLPKGTNLKIFVFDISGRELDVLANGFVPAGKFEVSWQAQKYSSGVYFLKLISSDFQDTKRMVLVK